MSEHAGPLTAREFQLAGGTGDWRVLGSGASAWYAASSHRAGAALAAAVTELDLAVDLDLDVRATGVRARLPLGPQDGGFRAEHVEAARAVARAAEGVGLAADPTVLQDVQLTFDVLDQATVSAFWEAALGYVQVGDEDVMDPGRRHPPIWFQDMDAPRPLRNRIHLDAVTTQPVAAATLGSLRTGPARHVAEHGYYATVADAEGNEVDVLPLPEGSDRWEGQDTEDWRLPFAAMACYPVPTPRAAAQLTEAVAALADEANLPVGIDVRPGLVTIDTGKDRWEMHEGYRPLAARIQQAARDLGLTADVTLPRFVQVGVDAVDIPAVRSFWRAALAYEEDPRPGVTDLVDPRRLNVVLFLQDLDPADEARRSQRNRIHLDVFVPDDRVTERVATAVAAGGRVVREAVEDGCWTIADPEGNELDIAVSPGREEAWRARQEALRAD
ncbi:VOC family protein [Ornithinimicrobium flavum]|uniref:VOC family protein n=1 Tax=Ornithinimicrobium flavum TaxID=1288636 RepID=UPI0013053658|nr:VOC family protein [Ornithinimicrobium flavum]